MTAIPWSVSSFSDRRNIHELPDMVDLPENWALTRLSPPTSPMSRNRLMNNLGYTPLRGLPRNTWRSSKRRGSGRKNGPWAAIYPLEPKRVAFCEARPLDALHITWDGFVTPVST